MITKLQYLRDEAISMIADLETKLRGMSEKDLEIVTARLTDLRLELEDRKQNAPKDGGGGRVYNDLLAEYTLHEDGGW
jgi:hypothetical protein